MLEYIIILGLQIGIPAIGLFYAYRWYKNNWQQKKQAIIAANNEGVSHYAFVDHAVYNYKKPQGEMFATIEGKDYYFDSNWYSNDIYGSQHIFYKNTGEKLSDKEAYHVKKLVLQHFKKLEIEEKENIILGIESTLQDPLQEKFNKLTNTIAKEHKQDIDVVKYKEFLKQEEKMQSLVVNRRNDIAMLLADIEKEINTSALISSYNLQNLVKRREEIIKLENAVEQQKEVIKKRHLPRKYLTDSLQHGHLCEIDMSYDTLTNLGIRLHIVHRDLKSKIQQMADRQNVINPLLETEHYNAIMRTINKTGTMPVSELIKQTEKEEQQQREQEQELYEIEEQEQRSNTNRINGNGR